MIASTRLNLAVVLLAAGCGGANANVPDAASKAAFEAPTPIESTKPKDTPERVEKALPDLGKYLERVLIGKKVEGEPIKAVEIVQARLFGEGRIHETWYLAIDIDGSMNHAALKIFPDDAAAKAHAEHFAQAREHGWPVPAQIAIGSAAPYSAKPAVLMEFIVGGSLKANVSRMFEGGEKPWPDDIAKLYGQVAATLGRLHKKTRARTAADRSAAAALVAMAASCVKEGWCDATAATRLTALSQKADGDQVTFSHGDLDETQVLLTPKGQVAAFVDFDQAGMADPATDIGSLLCQSLLLMPTIRAEVWGVSNATEGEAKAVGKAILNEYRKAAGVPDEAWPAFLSRVEASMFVRLGDVMVKFRGNPHAKYLLDALADHAPKLMQQDVFAAYGLR